MKKKLVAIIILVSVMAVSLPVSTCAASIITEPTSDEFILTNEIAEQIINLYKTNPDTTYQITDSTQLTGFNGDLYTYYELSPYGFAILYNSTGSLMEAYYESNFTLPISCTNSDVIYYGGPGIYATYENEFFVNLVDNEILSTQILEYVTTTQNNARSILTTVPLTNLEIENVIIDHMGMSDSAVFVLDEEHNVAPDFFNSITDVPENTQGICTIIATSLILAYYDQFLNDNFANAECIQGNGPSNAFCNLLSYYVYGLNEPGGTNLYNVAKGINHYLTDQGLNYKFSIVNRPNSAVIEKMVYCIENGNPIVASIDSDLGGFGDHAMLIYGVTYNSTSGIGTAVFRCHKGYDDQTDYLASATWFAECMYLEEGAQNHEYSAWENYDDTFHTRECSSCRDVIYLPHRYSDWLDYNNTYHRRLCITCDNVQYEAHADHWNELTSRCAQCNHTGTILHPINGVIDPILYAICLYE